MHHLGRAKQMAKLLELFWNSFGALSHLVASLINVLPARFRLDLRRDPETSTRSSHLRRLRPWESPATLGS